MIDAPLGLTNVITVVLAVSSLSVMAAQARAGVVRLWLLAIPAVFAAVVAIVLLAGVFDATMEHDAEWLAGLRADGLIGRICGRTLGGILAAVGLVVLSMIDFASAALRSPVIDPVHVAAGAAFCAGFIGWRAVAIIGRSSHATHVELHAAEQH